MDPKRKQLEAAQRDMLATMEARMAGRTRMLFKRVQELNCLLAISKLNEQTDMPLEKILRAVADLVVSAWQYPDITCARITIEEMTVETTSFIETPWKQSCDIILDNERIGFVEVYYLEARPEMDHGPFLKEEAALLEAVAQNLQRIIARQRMALEMKSKTRSLEELNMALNAILRQRSEDKARYEKKLVQNAKSLISPFLDQLAAGTRDPNQLTLIDTIRNNLRDAVSSFSHSLGSRYFDLSPVELRVANLVKQGRNSREIAGALDITEKTVKNHRYNIRRKVGISNKGMNLRTFLMAID